MANPPDSGTDLPRLHMTGLRVQSSAHTGNTGNSVSGIYTTNMAPSYLIYRDHTFVSTVNIFVVVSGGIVLFYKPV